MKKVLGILILLLIAGGIVLSTQVDWANLQRAQTVKQDWINIAIYYGGEKASFLNNPHTQKILEQHKIRLDAAKAGSIEQVTTLSSQDKDCLWPSNQIAVDLAKQAGKNFSSDTNIFNSAMVFYAWRPVTDALIKAGVIERDSSGILKADTEKLIALVQQQKSWKADLGVDVYGKVKVFTTDPAKSNSGNMWAGLLANSLNNGNVVTSTDLPTVLPAVQQYFNAMGYMEHSSGDIFETFLKQGMGAKPIIVGYENQLVEFMLAHENFREVIREKIDIIYPTPTVFASHPLIALTPACKRLEAALTDPQLQALAWKEHGFRSGLIGVNNDPKLLSVSGIPETVNQVIPMPDATVMQRMIENLGPL